MKENRSVQFQNVDDVIAMYNQCDYISWAIFSNNQLMFKYVGSDEQKGIELFKQTIVILKNSAAIYTVRLYEKIDKRTKINFSTGYDSSFNFRLLNDTVPYGFAGRMENEISKRLDRIDERFSVLELEKLQRESDDDDDDDDSGGFLGSIEKIPGATDLIKNLVASLATNFSSSPAQNRPLAIGAVPSTDEEKISSAITILANADEKLPDHLYKLATIAQTQPDKFKMIVSLLENF